MYLLDNGEKVYFDNAKRLVVSNFGYIYRDDDLAIKKYKDDDDYFLRITEDLFNNLSEVDSKALLNLKDVYTDFINLFDDLDYNETCVTGYTYDFVNKDNEKMIDKPIDYTLNTIHELDLLVKELNKRGILLDDPNCGNSIVTKDNLVIIDPDLFEINQSEKELLNNYSIANQYLAYKWADEYSINDHNDFKTLMKNLFDDFDNDFNIDYYNSMSKRLSKVKTPREYISKVLGQSL